MCRRAGVLHPRVVRAPLRDLRIWLVPETQKGPRGPFARGRFSLVGGPDDVNGFFTVIALASMPGDDLLFQRLSVSTIGAVWFHGRVRDGIGWVTDAMVTKQWSQRSYGF